MELCDQSASELAGMLRKGEVSSREITESVFKRIDEREKTINAYITNTSEIALKQADLADKKFREGKSLPLLNGIPVVLNMKSFESAPRGAILEVEIFRADLVVAGTQKSQSVKNRKGFIVISGIDQNRVSLRRGIVCG